MSCFSDTKAAHFCLYSLIKCQYKVFVFNERSFKKETRSSCSLLVLLLCQHFSKLLFMPPSSLCLQNPPPCPIDPHSRGRPSGAASANGFHTRQHQRAALGVFIHLPGPSTVALLHQDVGTPSDRGALLINGRDYSSHDQLAPAQHKCLWCPRRSPLPHSPRTAKGKDHQWSAETYD